MKVGEKDNNILGHYFRVKYNDLMSRSELDINTFGTNVSGYKKYDRCIPYDEIDTMANILKISDLFKNSVPIRIVNAGDSDKIYELILDYLNYHVMLYQTQLYMKKINLDIYIALDNLANSLYKHVRLRFEKQTDTHSLMMGVGTVYSNPIVEHRHQNPVYEEEINGVKFTNITLGGRSTSLITEINEKPDYSTFFKNILS